MAEQQVWAGLSVTAGASRILHWNWTGWANNMDVPAKTVLDITTLTFNYIPPSGAANVARVVIDGLDPKRGTVWNVDVYVEKEKTLHLPFPLALRLEPGGHVEVTAGSDAGVYLGANGRLIDV
jgi:hypothetical protein